MSDSSDSGFIHFTREVQCVVQPPSRSWSVRVQRIEDRIS